MNQQARVQMVWPKPGKVLIGLMVALVVVYVLELLLLRAGVQVQLLFLSPSGVFDRGYVWQLVTYWWLHDPQSPFHLLFNLLWLWMFGTALEEWWGGRRFLTGFVIFGLGGAALTLLIGLLATTSVMQPLLPTFWTAPHVGSSGAVMGVTVAWGITFANKDMNFLLLGQMKGKTFVMIIIAVELLVALSYSGVSSTSHFGGMIAAFILCRGLWRPSKWKDLFRRNQLQRKKKKIQSELELLQGGKDDPKNWN